MPSFNRPVLAFVICAGCILAAERTQAENLQDLTVSNGGGLDTAFSPTILEYDVTLDGGSSSIDVTATVRRRQLVSIDGAAASSQSQSATISNLVDGDVVEIVATRGNGRNPDTYTLNIIVPSNTAPTIAVTSNAQTIDAGDAVVLSANAHDFQDSEAVLDQSLTWISDLDGPVASGNDQSVILASTGTHTITVTVTDSGGLSASDQVSINVNGGTFSGPPAELVAYPYSGTSVGLHWEADPGATSYTVRRDGLDIAQVQDRFFVDTGLDNDTVYEYEVLANAGGNRSEASSITVRTLVNSSNDGLSNGSPQNGINDALQNFAECSNVRRVAQLDDSQLDDCLQAMLALNEMSGHLEDIRAFAARVRSEQSAAMVELGMRLFHSKSLSPTRDVSCSSCHHPALGCGGDNLSMPVGVDPLEPDLLGPGRSDGANNVPIVARNAPPTCNSALWTRGLFWDNRVNVRNGNRGTILSTDSDEVTSLTLAAIGADHSLTLLMAQAHFPVTAAPEMADIGDFGYDDTLDSDHTDFREIELADSLDSEAWGPLFAAAYGDSTIDYSRIAQAISAYEAVQIFIDNPFFDYVSGNSAALTATEKRGAIVFMGGRSGCTNCHGGSFFSGQGAVAASYPQIGVGTDPAGSGADQGATTNGNPDGGVFRAPSLLNVGITGPWGHNGQWGELRRNVEHYVDIQASITQYFLEEEMCDLEQFAGLPDCANQVAPNGLALTQENFDTVNPRPGRNLTADEVDWLVEFLHTLTDPAAADPGSNEILSLVPPADGGPDGQQLDAYDRNGDPL